MDNINFQGKTVLITSPIKYAERIRTISHDKANLACCTHMRPGVTKKCDINDGDIFVLVHNGNDGQLRRVEYDIQIGAKTLIDKICEDLQNFGKDLKENITCVIMGGRSRDSVTTKCVNDIANSVESYLAANDKKGDLSIICGFPDVINTSVFVDCPKGIKIPKIYIPANIEGEVSAEKLEDVFDMVELNNMDIAG